MSRVGHFAQGSCLSYLFYFFLACLRELGGFAAAPGKRTLASVWSTGGQWSGEGLLGLRGGTVSVLSLC